MVRFLVFADLHYKKEMYAVKLQHLQQIMERAKADKVDFVLHAGDFSNDYHGSPELVKEYLNNEYNLSVYGVYGNHELESKHNSMELVTPLLTNDTQVTWGTADGKIGDGSIGYYFFFKNGYRFICLDTNYSYNESTGQWEHNRTASWGAPGENQYPDSLGTVQLNWLEDVLMDAAKQKIPCILVSHVGFAEHWRHSPDTNRVQALIRRANKKMPGTVVMCINGHYHTNHLLMQENVLYFDVNAAINGSWVPKKEHHYSEAHTFVQDHFDAEGNLQQTQTVPLTALWQSVNTHYFADPLSAVVTITEDGKITVAGCQTKWCYGVEPVEPLPGIMPWISDGYFEVNP